MQNSFVGMRDTESSQNPIVRKTRLKTILAGALLLAAGSATAGIVFLPASGRFTNPELAPVDVQRLDENIVRVHTTGLNGELSLKGSDFPPEYGAPLSATQKLLVSQELELVIDLSRGVVEGRASGHYINSTELWDWWFHADVRGTASCLPLNGLDCGRLLVDLEWHGALSDPLDPARVGLIRTQMLGSLIVNDGGRDVWTALSANTTIGGNEGLIGMLSWSEGDWNLDGE